nr:hypothetical protein [Streptomyces sp. CBMA29]
MQTVALVPLIRRLRSADSAVRSEARLALLDSVGNLLILGSLPLTLLADSWFWLTLAGLAVVAPAMTAKGVRLLRARRPPTA